MRGHRAPTPEQVQALLFGIRGSVLLIVHVALRGRRWCRLRRKALRPLDGLLLWADAALTLLSRRPHPSRLDAAAEEGLLATLAHDILMHAPALLFVRAAEQEQFVLAMCVSCASLLARATVAKVFGGAAYAGLAALALRHVWVAAASLTPAAPSRRRRPQQV